METVEPIALIEAVGRYVDSFKSAENLEGANRELYKFVNWCGAEKLLTDLHPSDVGEYADQVGGTGTTPLAAERLQVVRDFLAFARKSGIIEVNLAQHVRIRKPKSRLSKSAIQEAQVVEMTPEGHALIVTQLETLKSERGPLAQQIQKAAADKDVRENAPLEAAREQLGLVESRIRDMEASLKVAVVVDIKGRRSNQTVQIGIRFSVKELKSGAETSYTLVSQAESNPLEGRISNVSPLGKAVVGCNAGREVEIDTPNGKLQYRVLKVSSK